jgi:type IV pilus assembly protein PilO
VTKKLNDLSPRAQFGIVALLCTAGATEAWHIRLGPARTDLATRQTRLIALQAEIARAHATAGKLASLEQEVRVLEASLRETTVVLPDEKDPQDVLRTLHELAGESALDLSNFAPKAVVTKTQYAEWPIELGLQGGYHDLGRFFDRIGSMSRLMSLADLQIKVNPKSNSRNAVTATCVATTFVFKKDIAPGTSPTLAPATRPGGAAAPVLGRERLPIGTHVGSAIGSAAPAGLPPSSTYAEGGRRDPFVTLLAPKPSTTPPHRPIVGLASVVLAEIAVKGIVHSGATTLAVLEGPGGRSFVARSQDRLQDATVRDIDADGVVFAERVVDAAGAVRAREVRKSLRPAAEGGR